MSLELTYQQYNNQCAAIANELAEECIAEANGDRSEADDLLADRLHETIDSHELVIYYAGNDTILRHSSNSDAYTDCYNNEDLGEIVKNEGLDKVKTIQAFFALEADVREYLEDAMDEAEAAYEAKNEAAGN